MWQFVFCVIWYPESFWAALLKLIPGVYIKCNVHTNYKLHAKHANCELHAKHA